MPIAPIDLNVVCRRVLALLLLGVLIGEVGVDLHHFQRLMPQMPLEREELAPFEQEASGISVAAGVRAHPLVSDATLPYETAEEQVNRLVGERAATIGQDERLVVLLWLPAPVIQVAAQIVVATLAQEELPLLGALAHDEDRAAPAIQISEADATEFFRAHAGVEEHPQHRAIARSEHPTHLGAQTGLWRDTDLVEPLDLLVGEDTRMLLLGLWQLQPLSRVVLEQLLNIEPVQEHLHLAAIALDGLGPAQTVVWSRRVA
jgi:hypothetical protein